MRIAVAALLLTIAALLSSSAPRRREQVGPLQNGGFLLNSGWVLRPAGRQIPVDTFPMASAVSRDGKHLLVLNAGYLPPSVSVIDVAGARETARVPVPDAWMGIAFNTAGDRLYIGGAAQASVFEYEFRDGTLRALRTFVAVPREKRKPQDFIGDVELSPDGKEIYAADLYHNVVLVFDLVSGTLARRFDTGSRPYRLHFEPGGKSLFVTGWADATLYRHDAPSGAITARIKVGEHPTDFVRAGTRLFVAAANTNAVFEIDAAAEGALTVVSKINVSLTPRQPVGMTPSALALSADGKSLYVACSDANTLAVVDISENGTRVAGFIPTGWYPTGARTLPDGRIAVLNSRGLKSYPNPDGPDPTQRAAITHRGLPADHGYIPRLQTGTVALIDVPTQAQLAAYTKTVLNGCPYRDAKLASAGVAKGNPIPDRPGAPTTIKHVLYIVKENRTYDQVLGDMKQGMGDPSLVLFGEDVTPNQHKIAREFVLFDNFYVNADVSADGHNWSTAAISPDYVEKLWGTSYGGRRRNHDYYGPGDAAAHAPGGYIWDRAEQAGLSIRNYGYYAENRRRPGPDGVHVREVGDPVLAKYTCMGFRGFDLEYPEYKRAEVFLSELAGYERNGGLPRFMIMHLGRNHTSGISPGRTSPVAMVADNDYAVGLIVEGLSKSKFWKDTAIFILEDDAQNGSDHIDSHRSPVFVVSAYTKRGVVDSTMYNTASVLRTMELILGMQPMTHFDAGARPMAPAFQAKADLRPFAAEKPRVNLEERNPRRSSGVVRQEEFDFDKPDRADDDELNAVLWRAIRGTDPPPPVRSAFSQGSYHATAVH